MSLILYIFIFSLIGGVFSLIGGVILLSRERLARSLSVHLISFAAGTLLGAALLTLLPEALDAGLEHESVFLYAALGFILFFLIEGVLLRFHHHHHEGEHGSHNATPWMLFIADSVHNFLDGVVIASAFFISVPLGIVTSFATAAHEVPQEIGDFSVMLHSGWRRKKVLILNLVSAFMASVGALVTFLFRPLIEPVSGIFLAVAAGFFLYIAGVDLIPELYHVSRRHKLAYIMILFLVGFALSFILSGLLGHEH